MEYLPGVRMTTTTPPIGCHVDLFCGPGGFATGFEQAGFSSLLAVDFYPPAIATYRKNHPSAATIMGDIRQVTNQQITSIVSDTKVSVITAGVPCEGFSLANRNRTKFVDDRNFLFLEFLRVVRLLKPPYIVLENVSGITGHSDGYFKSEITKGMQELGYVVDVRMLDAQDYGVPQRRKRVFFIGRAPGWDFRWPAATHGRNDGQKEFVTVRDAIGDLPPLGNNELINEYSEAPSSEYSLMMRGSQNQLLNHRAPNHPAKTIERIERTKPGEPMYPAYRQRVRLDPSRPSPTIISGGIRPQFHYGHPTQARGMSVRERARLQSFPDSYEFIGGLVQGRVLTGDAVPPLLAAAIAKSIANGIAAGFSKKKLQEDKVLIASELARPKQLKALPSLGGNE